MNKVRRAGRAACNRACERCGKSFGLARAGSPTAVCGECRMKELYAGQTWGERVQSWSLVGEGK